MSILVTWLESLHGEMNVTTKCSRERNIMSTCTYCIQKCEYNAIEIHGDLTLIDTKRCTFCGECMMACPLSAIEGVASSRFFKNRCLVFDGSYTPSIKELLIYKKRGMTSIQVSDPLNQHWETVLNRTNEQLQMLGENPIEVVNKVVDGVLSRRAFFGSFQREGKQLAKNMAPTGWKMEKDDWKLTKYFPDYQFYSLEMDKDQCTLCQACFSFCTEEVFQIKDCKLWVDNEKCVNCTSCTDICPENAIKIVFDIKRKNEQFENVDSKTCKSCGQPFYTFNVDTERCHICVNRDPDWLSPY